MLYGDGIFGVGGVKFPGTQAMKKNPKVDAYFRNVPKWRKELEALRKILLDCELTEELKWGKPCYAFQEKNIIILYGLKESCAIGFFRGALFKDTHGILIIPGPNTQSGRWIKFTDLQDITGKEEVLRAYIRQAIEVQKAGLEVVYKKTSDFVIPEEVQRKLDKIPALKKAFAALTPGRQRGYLIYFSAAKQSKTREARVEKWMPQILKGKGMQDR